jgi:hypothetical protein
MIYAKGRGTHHGVRAPGMIPESDRGTQHLTNVASNPGLLGASDRGIRHGTRDAGMLRTSDRIALIIIIGQ